MLQSAKFPNMKRGGRIGPKTLIYVFCESEANVIDNQRIEFIKEKIINTVFPEKIILFGSYAKGTQQPDSDLDLMVIWNTDMNMHKRNVFLSRLFPKRDFSLDIFAFTEKNAEELKDITGTIPYEAFHNGKIIYG